MNQQPPNQAPNSGAAQGQQGRAVAQPPAGSNAQPGSGEILYAGIAKHSSRLGGYMKWVGVTVLGGAIAIALNQFGVEAPIWLSIVLWMIGLPGVLWTYLVHISSKYKVSHRRVETELGVLTKRVDSLELWRVLDVEYTQSLVDRMFDNARIKLISTDQTNPELILHGLPRHRELFEALRDAVQNARQTNRPMELVPGADFGEGASELM